MKRLFFSIITMFAMLIPAFTNESSSSTDPGDELAEEATTATEADSENTEETNEETPGQEQE